MAIKVEHARRATACGTAVVSALVAAMCCRAYAQPAPQKLTIGVYAPSVEFGTAQARLAYAQGLAKAVEQSTGIKTEAQSYATLAALRKDNVELAIVDGLCVATNPSWRLLASATIGGAATRTWGLFTSGADTMLALKGKTLAFVQTGCNDVGFVDNAMLESEIDATFFAARIGEKDLTGAVADVASYKTAQAVFAPLDAGKGMKKLFDAAPVPNPGFVMLATRLPAGVADKIAAAVIGYGGSGAIAGWARPSPEAYTALAARLARVTKTGVFAAPEPVRIDGGEVLVEPPTLRDPGFASLRHHFVHAARERMD
jgi:hypothetical protein